MSEDETKESIDQPEKESEDQPENESREQDDANEDADQPEGESEDTVEVDGKDIPLSELKQGYMREADYRKKTQTLAEQQRELAAKLTTKEVDDKYTPDQKEALKTLKDLGMATTSDVESLVRRVVAQNQVATEREKIKTEFELDEDMAYAAQALAMKKGVPLKEAAKLLSGKKVVRKKGLSPKGGVGSTAKTSKGDEVTPEFLKSLDMNNEKDVKKFEEIRQKWEDGEL
jgi:hypothetical protein